MTELYDEDGNAVEAFTKEDLDAKVSETEGKFQDKISELSTELEKEQIKEKNFAKLRDIKSNETAAEKAAREADEAANKTTIADLEKKIDEAQNAGVSRVLEMQRSSVFSELSGGDEELEAKIAANYALINKPEGTVAEIASRAKDALLLSMDMTTDEIFGTDVNITPPSGHGRAVGSVAGKEVSADLKDIGDKFGITDADWKKFS